MGLRGRGGCIWADCDARRAVPGHLPGGSSDKVGLGWVSFDGHWGVGLNSVCVMGCVWNCSVVFGWRSLPGGKVTGISGLLVDHMQAFLCYRICPVRILYKKCLSVSWNVKLVMRTDKNL